MSAPGPPGRGCASPRPSCGGTAGAEGRGGKRQDGIAEAIRVKVKCDTAGVGHDAAEPFTFHWWDHVFNKAAANIAVEAGQDGISVKALSEQGGGISNKKPRKAGGTRDLLYGRFVKSATLTACGEESMTLPTGSESSEEEEKLDLSSARRLTDEELVQACGGRTAHKGARHGLTMSAKLARLEEQERAFLAMYRHKERQQELLESPLAESQGKKKKRKKSRDRADPEVPQSQESNGKEESIRKRSEGCEEEEKEDPGAKWRRRADGRGREGHEEEGHRAMRRRGGIRRGGESREEEEEARGTHRTRGGRRGGESCKEEKEEETEAGGGGGQRRAS
ncbi:G patch domain-containing protein 4 [Chiroxiphia lanceolata]|uniref:G patch domain-containing protein 4 n=1 Tax=Chiroxiphia lanceolata TaxID=296741 RepID=UPI0013CE75F2|nr:G patch domain-containing protein 4 [Chiroxiphia lanceolata]